MQEGEDTSHFLTTKEVSRTKIYNARNLVCLLTLSGLISSILT